MNTVPDNGVIISFVVGFLLLLLSNDFSSGTETDILCLENIKKSLKDRNNYLSSWDFTNRTEGNLCKFSGVMCWHTDENRLLSIKLSHMGLKGQFPLGIVNCTSLTALDLSNNELSGLLPSNISQILGFLTTLDLSSNAFTGPIPKSLANCSYLNVLKLDHNQLTGEIPPELGSLNRLTTFNVANNLLSGPVPHFINLTSTAGIYDNNPGLCGGPSMNPCPFPKRLRTGAIARSAVGGVVLAVVSVGICLLFFLRMRQWKRRRTTVDETNAQRV